MSKILIIDDKYDNLISIKALLKNYLPGCTIITSQSGHEGLTLVINEKPDTVILDVIMPEMDGFEVCRRIKGNKEINHIPVILLTAIKKDSQSRIKGLENGADAFLSKPIEPVELTAQIKVMLRIKNAEDKLRNEKEDLEKLIEIRTEDLIESNNQLKAEIGKSKERENELRKLTVTMDQSPVSIMITDLLGNIEYVNPKFCSLTGYSQNEALGENPRFLKGNEKSKEEYKKLWNQILSGNVWRGEFHNKKKNGELYWENAIIAPIMDDTDKILNLMAIKEDISIQKQLESDNHDLSIQLQRTQRLKTIGTLAGGIAHDFNNLLVPILGYSDLILSELSESDNIYDLMKEILNAGYRAKELVEEILLFSKQVERKKKPINLSTIVSDAMKLLRPSIPSTITIEQNLGKKDCLILADSSQVHQVIVNLCTNAWQAMENKKGKLIVILKTIEMDSNLRKRLPDYNKKKIVYLSIEDNGCGMKRDTIEHIFDPFFTTKSVNNGTGLGLSIVYGIIQRHNGRILIDSEPGKGTIFHLYFPFHLIEDNDDERKTIKMEKNEKSILIVNDDEMILNMISKMLVELGYKTFIFNCNREALETYRKEPGKYDLLISDFSLPDKNDFQLLEEFKIISNRFSIILLESYKDENLDKPGIRKLAINEFLDKPFTRKKLANIVRKALG